MEEVAILPLLGAPSPAPPDAATLPPPATVSTSRTGGTRSLGPDRCPTPRARSTGEIAAFGKPGAARRPQAVTETSMAGPLPSPPWA